MDLEPDHQLPRYVIRDAGPDDEATVLHVECHGRDAQPDTALAIGQVGGVLAVVQ